MTAHGDGIPLVQVPASEIDETWVGEQLLVTHQLGVCSRWSPSISLPRGHRRMRCIHFGGLSDLLKLPASNVLFIGGEQILVTAADVIVAQPTPTALDAAADVGARPYDT